MKDRIQAIMEAKGMAQNIFAQTLELSPATISSIFTGRTNPTNNHVQAIHRAFPEININWLLFGEGEMYTNGGEENDTPFQEKIEQNQMSEEMSALASPATSAYSEVPLSLFPETMSPVHEGKETRRGGAQAGSGQLVTAEWQAMVLAELARMNNQDKVERKIKEIRVFYSDGTFEAFAPLVK